MKKAIMSNSKSCNHSDKDCVCGGHSKKDVKKNKHHHATKMRLMYRKSKTMKPLLLILLLAATVCNGQKDTTTLTFSVDTSVKYSIISSGSYLTMNTKPVYDTSRVIICYIDTSHLLLKQAAKIDPVVMWQFGYEVREYIGQYYGSTGSEKKPLWDDNIRQFYDVTERLYADRRPLPKSLIIIQSIKL